MPLNLVRGLGLDLAREMDLNWSCCQRFTLRATDEDAGTDATFGRTLDMPAPLRGLRLRRGSPGRSP
jgi:hypothetical protein